MTLTRPLTSTATLTLTPSLTLHLDPRAKQPAERAADVMRIQQTIKPQRYERGVDLLTSVVAMLTKMI